MPFFTSGQAHVAALAAVGAVLVAVLKLRRHNNRLALPHPSALVTSLQQKSVAISEVKNLLYSHGGFMGAAPACCASPQWLAVLSSLTPTTYEALAKLALRATPRQVGSAAVMRTLENNPVVAAFATLTLAQRGTPCPVIEFDVYLDASVGTPDSSEPESTSILDVGAATNKAFPLLSIAKSTIVAHGTAWHWITEHLLRRDAYTDVRRSSGNLSVVKWLATYSAVLAASDDRRHPTLDSGLPATRPLASVFLDVKSRRATAAKLRQLVLALNTAGVHVWGVGSFRHSQVDGIDAGGVQSVIVGGSGALSGSSPWWEGLVDGVGNGDLSVVGERGFTHVDPHVAAAAVAVATSRLEALLQQQSIPSHIDVKANSSPCKLLFPPALPIRIVTFVGEVLSGATSGTLPPGSHILFNGGTMLTVSASSSDNSEYTVDSRVLSALAQLVAENHYALGFYVQEPTLEPAAISALAAVADAHPGTFTLGFAYSALPGQAAADIASSSRSSAGVRSHLATALKWLIAPPVARS